MAVMFGYYSSSFHVIFYHNKIINNKKFGGKICSAYFYLSAYVFRKVMKNYRTVIHTI